MLLDAETLQGIRTGTVTLAFRRWKRPTVKAGGSLLTPAGRLSIGRVDAVDLGSVTPAEARQAGFAGIEELAAALAYRDEQIYRIELGPLGEDPRLALRENIPNDDEVTAILGKLAGMDSRAGAPWTGDVLRIIERRPGVRAGDLAEQLGVERLPFKASVRKLKALGLTISLEVGYELSARGRVILDALSGADVGKRGTD